MFDLSSNEIYCLIFALIILYMIIISYYGKNDIKFNLNIPLENVDIINSKESFNTGMIDYLKSQERIKSNYHDGEKSRLRKARVLVDRFRTTREMFGGNSGNSGRGNSSNSSSNSGRNSSGRGNSGASRREGMMVRSRADNNDYDVISYFNDPTAAANMLGKVNLSNQRLIAHMKKKYIDNPSANMSSKAVNKFGYDFVRGITERIIEKYSGDVLRENDPVGDFNNTSWSQNKGEILAYCVRDLPNNGKEFVDTNTLMFVNLHELGHVSSVEYGHELEFWNTMEVLLMEAVELGMYDPVDYSKEPITYCGLPLDSSPLFS